MSAKVGVEPTDLDLDDAEALLDGGSRAPSTRGHGNGSEADDVRQAAATDGASDSKDGAGGDGAGGGDGGGGRSGTGSPRTLTDKEATPVPIGMVDLQGKLHIGNVARIAHERVESEAKPESPHDSPPATPLGQLSKSLGRIKSFAQESGADSKQRAYRVLVLGKAADQVELRLRNFLTAVIFVGTLSVMTETVVWESSPVLADAQYTGVRVMEAIVVTVFTVEYVLRVWCWDCNPLFNPAHPVLERLRFIVSSGSLLDALVCFGPMVAVFVVDGDTVYFAAEPEDQAGDWLRVIRGLRLLKFARYSPSAQALWQVAINKREELVSAGTICGAIVMLLSLLVYVVEHGTNDGFPNLIVALWWGVISLTTVGYGDIFPTSNVGRVLGAFGAVLGIGLFTLPAGIIASGFLDMREEEKRKREHVLNVARRTRRKVQMFYAWQRWSEEAKRIRGAAKASGAFIAKIGAAEPVNGWVKIASGQQAAAGHLLRETRGDLSVAVQTLVSAYFTRGGGGRRKSRVIMPPTEGGAGDSGDDIGAGAMAAAAAAGLSDGEFVG